VAYYKEPARCSPAIGSKPSISHGFTEVKLMRVLSCVCPRGIGHESSALGVSVLRPVFLSHLYRQRYYLTHELNRSVTSNTIQVKQRLKAFPQEQGGRHSRAPNLKRSDVNQNSDLPDGLIPRCLTAVDSTAH
jgi:hypothetical protein